MKKLYVVAFSALMLAGSFSSQIFAQQAERQLIQVNQLELKSEMVDQFRGIHRDIFMPRNRASGQAWRLTSRVALGNTLQMILAFPIANMAALDAQGGGGLSGTDLQLVQTVFPQTIQSRRSFIVTSRPDMSMAGQPQTGLTVSYRFQVKSGKIPEFVQLWNSKVIPALTASNVVGTSVFQTVQGGRVGEFFSLTPIPDFASVDGPGPFGGIDPQEAQALNLEMANLLDEMEITYNRVDMELSYGLPGLQQ
jgi:hypothetical protein